VEVEDDTVPPPAGHVDGDHRHAAERAGHCLDGLGHGVRGEQLLEDRALFDEVAPEVERPIVDGAGPTAAFGRPRGAVRGRVDGLPSSSRLVWPV
jgi:hypothetical protein